jgi:hypothetical protein
MDYREADNRVFDIIEESRDSLDAAVRETRYKKSYVAMLAFVAKAASLKLALFDLLGSENAYAFNVVFRSLCEHYVKFMYIWVRFLSESSDAVGEEYYTYCGASELIDYANAFRKAEDILGRKVVVDYEEFLHKVMPITRGMDLSDVRRKSDQFRYGEIIRYVAAHVPEIASTECQFLVTIIPRYAELSSFVHGGPATDQMMLALASEDGLDQCRQDASLAFFMYASTAMFAVAAMSREFPSLCATTGRINSVIEEYFRSEAAK